ncbi:MAG: hypothetical protein AAB778_01920 [Patescibacteria group bacterium]
MPKDNNNQTVTPVTDDVLSPTTPSNDIVSSNVVTDQSSPVISSQLPVTDSGSAAPSDDIVIPPIITSPSPKKKFAGGKVIATILGLFLLVGGVGAGVMLTQQNQDIREKACDPGVPYNECYDGVATLPEKPNLAPGETEQCGMRDGEEICVVYSANGGTVGEYRIGGSGGSWEPVCNYPIVNCPPGQTIGTNVVSYGEIWGTGLHDCGDRLGSAQIIGEILSDGGASGNPTYQVLTYQCNPGCPPDSTSQCNTQPGEIYYVVNGGCTRQGYPDGDTLIATEEINCTGMGLSRVCDIRRSCQGTVEVCTCSTPPPTTPPVVTPSPTPITAQCQNVKAYSATWDLLTSAQLAALKPNNTVNFCVTGVATGGSFDRAKFTINSAVQAETTTVRPSSTDYCQSYTIPTGTTTFNVTAQIHHVTLGWK